MNTLMHKYIIYTDGACIGNPGPGGWAAILMNEKDEKILSGRSADTTNNRMEMLAIITALEYLSQKSLVTVFTDSKYVIDGISSWIIKWEKNNWRTSKNNLVKNYDLWKKLNSASKNHKIKWEWVKGHSGDFYNEKVDNIARDEALRESEKL